MTLTRDIGSKLVSPKGCTNDIPECPSHKPDNTKGWVGKDSIPYWGKWEKKQLLLKCLLEVSGSF